MAQRFISEACRREAAGGRQEDRMDNKNLDVLASQIKEAFAMSNDAVLNMSTALRNFAAAVQVASENIREFNAAFKRSKKPNRGIVRRQVGCKS